MPRSWIQSGISALPSGFNNSFENQSHGTTVTTGNSASPTAFDLVNIASGASVVFDNTYPAHGGMGLKVDIGATGGASTVRWNTTATEGWGRVYYYHTDVPVTGRYILGVHNTTALWHMRVNTSNPSKITIQNNIAGTTISTNSLTVGQLYRFEFHYVVTSGTTGTVEVRIHAGDSSTIIETVTATSQEFGFTAPTTVRFGNVVGTGTNIVAYLDDLNFNTVGWPGSGV